MNRATVLCLIGLPLHQSQDISLVGLELEPILVNNSVLLPYGIIFQFKPCLGCLLFLNGYSPTGKRVQAEDFGKYKPWA